MQLFHSIPSECASARASVRFPLAAVALAAAAIVQPAAAQEAQLSTTIVTAARSETKLDETLADVAVVTREQINSIAPGRSVVDILQRLAGGHISSSGGRGSTQSVFMRGTASSHTLLLIDGVRYGSATMATPVLENLPIEMIERIEVVKGPASALYGSEAIGGVIQIFTKRASAKDQPLKANAAVTAGTHHHRSANMNLYGAQAGFDYELGVSRVVDHGFSASNPKSGAYTYNPDKDPFDQTAVNAGLGFAINADWRIDAKLLKSEGTIFTDSGAGSNPSSELGTQVANVKLSGQVQPGWKTSLFVGSSKDEQINQATHFNTRQTEVKWDHTINTRAGVLLAGVERLEQKVDTSTVYAVDERYINALLLGLNGSANRHSWQLNVRHDDNSQFGGFTTYGLNYGFEVAQGIKLLASHGKSMRAPSFNDLYYVDPNPSYTSYNGNPNLKPEQSKNHELGVQWSHADHQLKWLAFDNTVTDLIASDGTQMANVQGQSKLRGWNLEYRLQRKDWSVSAAYSHLNAKQSDGLVPVRRAKHQASFNVDRSMGAWKLGSSVLYVGKREDNDWVTYTRTTLPSYTTVDVYAEYKLQRDWALQARIANLTNRDYETAYGFNQLGRAAYVTLKWTPQ